MSIDLDTLGWTEIESSSIDAIALNDGRLYVRFNSGSVYSYEDDASEEVESLHLALVGAAEEGESVGRLFHALVRGPQLPYEVEDTGTD